MSRQYVPGVHDQHQLMTATQAYLAALPLPHQQLIVELSAQRDEAPMATLGRAIADGLERLVDEVTNPSSGA